MPEGDHDRRGLSSGPLSVADSRGFSRAVAEACATGDLMAHRDFALGFAAGVDAMVCGTVNASDPMATVAGAIQDAFYEVRGSYRVSPNLAAARKSPFNFAVRGDDAALGDCHG